MLCRGLSKTDKQKSRRDRAKLIAKAELSIGLCRIRVASIDSGQVGVRVEHVYIIGEEKVKLIYLSNGENKCTYPMMDAIKLFKREDFLLVVF
jgi:hypothetical protein